MKQSAHVSVSYENKIPETNLPGLGIVFVVAKTPKGSYQDPKQLINSKGQLELYFGEESANYPHMRYLKDILNEGGRLRIARILGTGYSLASATVQKGSDDYFALTAQNPGMYYNNLEVIVSAATDGDPAHFDLRIKDTTSGQTEFYPNIDPSQDVGSATGHTYLKDVEDKSTLVTVTYKDLTTITGIPDLGTTSFAGGGDGGSLSISDYENALSSFDNYEDGYYLVFPGEDDDSLTGIDSKGVTYASGREDIIYVGNIPNSLTTSSQIKGFLNGLGITSRYTVFSGGGLKINDDNGTEQEILSHSAATGFMAKVSANKGVWISPAGTQAGSLLTGHGVVNNFGAPNLLDDLHGITNAGGNMIVKKGGLIYIKDAYTMSQDSVDKYISVVMLDIYMRKLLVPVFESALWKQNDQPTWEQLYYQCKPYLDDLVDQGAIRNYDYNGDQFNSDPANWETNLPQDVANGIYKVKLWISTISPMVEIQLTISKTADGVTIQ